jgi:hypothetical protein
MTGINLQGIIELIDQFYLTLIVLAGTVGTFYAGNGVLLLRVAIQMGGMNSMGTRSFYSEAAMKICVGIICWYLIAFISGIGEEIVGMQFEWDEPLANTDGYLLGVMVLKIIRLTGVYLCFKGTLSLTNREGGGFGSLFRTYAFGLIAIFIVPFGEALGQIFGFNPVALFAPPASSIIVN